MKYLGTQPHVVGPFYCSNCSFQLRPGLACPACNSAPSQDLIFPVKKPAEDRLQELAVLYWLEASSA